MSFLERKDAAVTAKAPQAQARLPDYLAIPAADLGRGTPVKVRILGDQADVARDMAGAIRDELLAARSAGRAATLILPVGPVDQYPLLAEMINAARIDCRDVVLINMDEYLSDDGAPVPREHPLSFTGFMARKFYDLLDPALAPRAENRVVPDPARPGDIARLIEDRGGVDACFGGIGINGHIAFNEPPEPGEALSAEAFAGLPTRVLPLSRETRTINSVTVGGEISVVPRMAVTVGMRECLGARRLRLYCNRPWQAAVVRRVLHGPVTAACPASLMRLHPDATLSIAQYVAEPPQIMLR
jgi:glucosamine-6-phosphate deaminase